MTTFIVETATDTIKVEAEKLEVYDKALVFRNEEGNDIAAFADGEWQYATSNATETASAEPTKGLWHFLPDVDRGVYVVKDSHGDLWSSYDGQLRWLRNKDSANARSVEYTGPYAE